MVNTRGITNYNYLYIIKVLLNLNNFNIIIFPLITLTLSN